VTFTLINDYYPGLLQFKKGHRQNYLVVAEREVADSGDFQGLPYTKAHYIATLAGSYGPSPYDYRSYAWGLGIGFFVFFFGGLAVYLYRRRRVRPYLDVPLHA
jgi:hypothetical protein